MGGNGSIVLERSRAFAVRVVRMVQFLRRQHREFVLSDQVLRSGTSIGANLAEAVYASSRKDFLNKHSIALKECSETLYWLDLLRDTGYLASDEHASMRTDGETIRRLLTAITKTVSTSLSISTPKPQSKARETPPPATHNS